MAEGRLGRLLGWLAVLAALGIVVGGGYLVLAETPGGTRALGLATPAPTRAPIGLWDAFERARYAAQAKALDVQLVSASTQWQAPSQQVLVNGTSDWSFVFYAPSQQSTLDVVADAGSVQVVKLTPAWVAPRTLDDGPWSAGPQDALLVFLAYEGNEFLAQHPAAVVDLNLARSEAGDAVWTITALDAQTREYLALVIDAASDEVLRCEKTNPGS